MTGKVVSLSRARKSKARDADRRRADENAARHGRAKAEKVAEAEREAKLNRDLDGHRRDE